MWVAFEKLLTFFQQKKFQLICVSLDVNFNESLTNDIVSFEQLDPDMRLLYYGEGTCYAIYSCKELPCARTIILYFL